jgi:hypothetical protein
MDNRNLFLTPATYRTWRLEHLAQLIGCVVLVGLHLPEIRWWVFVLLFAQIDLIGYVPGAIVYRRRKGRVPPGFYVLYNVTHSLVTQLGVALAWSAVFGPEWALLALPIHLLGDRALFGNFLKPFCIAFEPHPHPSFTAFVHQLDEERQAHAHDH